MYLTDPMALVARVKRIINTDEDVNGCASNAAFLITVATVCLHWSPT